jgi:hypothetical protein
MFEDSLHAPKAAAREHSRLLALGARERRVERWIWDGLGISGG